LNYARQPVPIFTSASAQVTLFTLLLYLAGVKTSFLAPP